MEFTLTYFQKQVKRNVLQAKKNVRSGAKEIGENYINNFYELIKEIYDSFPFTRSISKALVIDEEFNITLKQQKINVLELIRGKVVINFDINKNLSLTRDIKDRNTGIIYKIQDVLDYHYAGPYVYDNLGELYPPFFGIYRVRMVNSIEYNFIKKKNPKSSIKEEDLLNSSFVFDFIDGLNRIIKLSSSKEQSNKILLNNQLEIKLMEFFE